MNFIRCPGNWAHVLWLLVTLYIVSTQGEIVISVKNGSSQATYFMIFSEEMFLRLETCMCGRNTFCRAKYSNHSFSPSFVIDDVSKEGNVVQQSVTNNVYYLCRQTFGKDFMTCSYRGPSMFNIANITSFLCKSVAACDNICISLKWTYSDEGILFPYTVLPHYPSCNTPAMTSSSLFPPRSPSTYKPAWWSILRTTPVSRQTTAKFPANRGIPTDSYSYTNVPTLTSSNKFSEPAADKNQAEDDDGAPIGVIVGAVASVIVITIIIVIAVIVAWKRRNTEHKSSEYSSKTGTLSTSSSHSKEQNNTKQHSTELHYVNIKPHTSRNGHENTNSIIKNNTHNITHNSRWQQDDIDDSYDDFGYDTAQNVSPGTDDEFSNDTENASQNSGTQQNRTSDDYGYAYAEDSSNKNNTTKRPNQNVSSVVATINENNNVKNSNDDYEDVYDDGEIPGMDTTMISNNPKDNVSSPSKTPPSDAVEQEDEYAVVNKNRSAATGEKINNDISSNNGDGASASTTSESKDVYSKLHETERHITDPYDSLSHLNSSLNVGNQPDPAQNLHSANQSSPYELAQPIPDTSANENGRAATEEFELAPVSSSSDRGESNALHKDEKNQALQGKKQAKKLPYGPEDYAVVIKKKT